MIGYDPPDAPSKRRLHSSIPHRYDLDRKLTASSPNHLFFLSGIDPGVQFHLPPVFRSRSRGPT